MVRERNVNEFNRDVLEGNGYQYTDPKRLSSLLANRRISEAILDYGVLKGKRVIDIGCGDGTYSAELARAGAAEVVSVDAAEASVERARKMYCDIKNLRFEVVDIYALEPPQQRYDVAVVRGLLHHLYDVEKAIERICKTAKTIVVLEPNGYNPVLKLLEKYSPYHVKHEEKSYRPADLDRWFENCGGVIERSRFIGLVPMFCPNWMARALKFIEPLVESMPLLRAVGCAQYIQRVRVE